jgi:hypothetical protein
MEDKRIDVLERLAATDPVRTADYDQDRADRVLSSILAEPRAKRRLARKRLVAAAAAVVAIGIAAPALAFSDSVRSFVGFDGPPELEEATLLLSAPVADETVVYLWRGRTTNGGECFLESYGQPGAVVEVPEAGGGICSDRPVSPSQIEGAVHVGVTKKPLRPRGAAEWVPPVISGHLDPALGVTRVAVEWTGGSKDLAYADGHFIGAAEPLYQIPDELLPVYVVAYDAEGREVYRREISASWFRLE